MLQSIFGTSMKLFGKLKYPIQRSYGSMPPLSEADKCVDRPGMDETGTKPATNVIVNLDGVVIDSIRIIQEGHSKYVSKWKKALNRTHKLKMMGRKTKDIGTYLSEELCLPVDGDVYAHGVWQHHRDWFRQNDPKLINGIEFLLCYFKLKNIPVALVTSSSGKLFDLEIKKYERLLDYFCHVVVGDDKDVKKGPPSPDLYVTAAKRFQAAPKDMEKYVVIDSSLTGIKTAHDAGMQTVFLPNNIIPASMHKADIVLYNLEKFNPKVFDWPAFPKVR